MQKRHEPEDQRSWMLNTDLCERGRRGTGTGSMACFPAAALLDLSAGIRISGDYLHVSARGSQVSNEYGQQVE